jgi:hypothetical protein
MTIHGSEHYLAKAVAALEKAEQQTHSTEAMAAHTHRADVLLRLHDVMLVREAAGLVPIEDVPPVAVLDCHGRLWQSVGDGEYVTTSVPGYLSHADLSVRFGPLRPAEVSQ